MPRCINSQSFEPTATKVRADLKIKRGLGDPTLDDVQSGRADFNHILVYDVSRWGRFQDTDESAHYEFICKKAGVKVAYCAEQFDNDGTMMSNILKNLKRVMAAEYSRELSEKVHAGASRYARMGFVLGGQASYGLSRQLVDEKLRPKALLKNGDRKYLVTDHVRLVPGTTDETAIVRWVFEQFLRKKSETAIARELNRMAVPTNTGRPWNRFTIGRLLRNENYIGNLIYNRRSAKLREKRSCNPPELWIRSEGSVEAIVERSLFLRARKVIEERRVSLSEEEMLTRLRKTLMKRGKLSPAIIDGTVGLPCTATYMNRLGSLRNVYRLIGYTPKRDYEYLESRARWADLNTKLASQVAAGIKNAGGGPTVQEAADCLLINGTVSIFFRDYERCAGKRKNHAPHWSIHHRDRHRRWLDRGDQTSGAQYRSFGLPAAANTRSRQTVDKIFRDGARLLWNRPVRDLRCARSLADSAYNQEKPSLGNQVRSVKTATKSNPPQKQGGRRDETSPAIVVANLLPLPIRQSPGRHRSP